MSEQNQSEPLVMPVRRPKKRGPNIGLIILATVAVLGGGGAYAILKYGAKVVPAAYLPDGVPSLTHAERCLRDGNIMCAEADYIAYLKLYPDDTKANALLAMVMTEDGRHKESLKYYKKAVSLGAATYDFHAHHAKTLEATGDIEGAIRANYAALDIAPSLVDVRGALADQLVRKGRAQEALNLLETFDRSLEDQGHPAYFPARIAAIKQRLGGAAAQAAAGAAVRERLAANDAAPAGPGVTLAPMTRRQGVLQVPVMLNGVVSADFIVDSGASHVVLSEDVFQQLIRSRTLSRGDFLGSGTAELADGSTVQADAYNLRSLKVGDRTLKNVTAMVSRGSRGQLLLGQSFLRRFKSWSVNNRDRVLELRD